MQDMKICNPCPQSILLPVSPVALFTFYTLKEWLKQPSAVNDRSNQNLFCANAVDDAVAVGETLSNRRVSDFRDNSTHMRKIGNRLCCLNNL